MDFMAYFGIVSTAKSSKSVERWNDFDVNLIN